MLLEAQNRRKMAHFIATCGRAYRVLSEEMLYIMYHEIVN